ncbi:unnamed protein product [Rotaria sp. Silwood2]|nr:unnamed protein product [Rotaria sp. Silwood2]
MVIIQKGKAPSLHLVTIAILTLRQTLRTHTSLIDYNKDHEISSSAENVSETEEEYVEEHEAGNVSDEFQDETDDELNKYLEQHIAIELIDDNPLRFWCEHRFIYPTLSRLARSIFSIPATTANVERQFSGSGLMINSRRTRLDPEQVNDALFLRSIFELYRRIAKYFNNIVVYVTQNFKKKTNNKEKDDDIYETCHVFGKYSIGCT